MEKEQIKQFQQAVFYSDIGTIKRIVESDHFDAGLLDNLNVNCDVNIPVTYFTAAQLEIFQRAEEWDNGRGWVIESYSRAVDVWHYWKDILHLDTNIDYHQFANSEIMFCAEEGSSDEEILDATYDELVKCGVRRVDAELFVACWRVDIEKVYRLYNAGADPYVRILEEDCYAMDHVASETCLLDVHVYHFYEDNASNMLTYEIAECSFMDLLGFGAFERMYNILHGRGILDYSTV